MISVHESKISRLSAFVCSQDLESERAFISIKFQNLTHGACIFIGSRSVMNYLVISGECIQLDLMIVKFKFFFFLSISWERMEVICKCMPPVN